MMRILFVVVSGLIAVTACASLSRSSDIRFAESPQFADGRFRNPLPRPPMDWRTGLGLAWDFLLGKPDNTVPQSAIPLQPLSRAALQSAPDGSLYRLGHSSVLIKLDGRYWLTDPMFSERASPVQWAGPARFHPPPIDISELPPLAAVVLSHNHYDHLDEASIRSLAERSERFVVPLGLAAPLIDWGVDAARIQELDWWQAVELGGVRLTATPAQHFSGRGLLDGDRSLWASWVIQSEELRVFFSGDTGYFDGFKTIGERFGPFDLTLLETGAYDPRWAYVHMQPEETLQAHLDLKGRQLLPIHNGTFDLALHPWDQPFERISALAAEANVALSTPMMGERLDLHAPHAGSPWWRMVSAAR